MNKMSLGITTELANEKVSVAKSTARLVNNCIQKIKERMAEGYYTTTLNLPCSCSLTVQEMEARGFTVVLTDTTITISWNNPTEIGEYVPLEEDVTALQAKTSVDLIYNDILTTIMDQITSLIKYSSEEGVKSTVYLLPKLRENYMTDIETALTSGGFTWSKDTNDFEYFYHISW